MKFFERATTYQNMRKAKSHSAHELGPLEWVDYLKPQLSGPTADIVLVQLAVEGFWVHAHRPYYSVWPSIAESLAQVKLDLDCGLIALPLPTLLIRFSDSAPIICNDKKMRSILVSRIGNVGNDLISGEGLALFCDFGETRSTADGVVVPDVSFRTFPLIQGKTVEHVMSPEFMSYQDTDFDHVSTTLAARVVVAVCLIAKDSELIEPDVLDKDKLKYEEAPSEALVERAHRRGKVGWIIGRQVEVSPHYRRAHFGIRWKGKGTDKKPELVPVKGCVVKRHKMSEVPTGYLDDEDDHTR